MEPLNLFASRMGRARNIGEKFCTVQRPITCPRCRVPYRLVIDFLDHYFEDHCSHGYLCPEPGCLFTSSKALVGTHIEAHRLGISSWECKTCSLGFKTHFKLARHKLSTVHYVTEAFALAASDSSPSIVETSCKDASNTELKKYVQDLGQEVKLLSDVVKQLKRKFDEAEWERSEHDAKKTRVKQSQQQLWNAYGMGLDYGQQGWIPSNGYALPSVSRMPVVAPGCVSWSQNESTNSQYGSAIQSVDSVAFGYDTRQTRAFGTGPAHDAEKGHQKGSSALETL